jgi:hypothetical protein
MPVSREETTDFHPLVRRGVDVVDHDVEMHGGPVTRIVPAPVRERLRRLRTGRHPKAASIGTQRDGRR